MKLFAFLPLLIACAPINEYPTPQPNNYRLSIIITDDQHKINTYCQRPVKACYYKEGLLIMHTNNWEHWITHEMGHVFGVNDHD